MEASTSYLLPKLPCGYKALAPYSSEEQLTLHHQKHHQAYVTGANALLEKFDKARKDNADLDMKASLKELSFHIGGFRLHKKFFEKLRHPQVLVAEGYRKVNLQKRSMQSSGNSTGSKRSLPRLLQVSKDRVGRY